MLWGQHDILLDLLRHNRPLATAVQGNFSHQILGESAFFFANMLCSHLANNVITSE